MADIVVPVAVEVAKCLGAPVGRPCSYVIFCDRYVRQLNDEIEKLVATKDDVLISIGEARNNIKPIKPRVEEWVKDAEAGATKARNMLENEGRAEKTCFYGWLPNPKARYRLGNEASKMIKEIKDLIEQGQFKRVDDKIAPPGLVGGASDVNSLAGDGGDFITDSRASVFQGIMKALNDEKVKVVGVYGPGGVGKTTLLEIVEKKLRKDRRPFRMIVKAEVSQTPDLIDIQGQIADALSLNLKVKETRQGRSELLFQRLQRDPNEKVLIILDDLWRALELNTVGIPLGDESMNCKLLLTSRDESVLEHMRADKKFRLEGLEHEEALRLFGKIVGDKLKDNEELKAKATRVVKKLAGLPLLITSVATTLKSRNVSAWESTLIKIEDPNIERVVKWSYDHVESEDAKCLFLLCGLIGGTIKVELLLGLGMGLGLFEGYNKRVQDSRNRLNEMLDSLQSFCLLQGGGYSADGKRHVTIHDLYSELVVSKAFGGENSLMMNSNYVPQSKEKKEKCWAICLADVDKDRLDKRMTYRFPGLKILMLSQQEGWRGRQEHDHEVGECSRLPDFTNMEELCALYLHSMHIAKLPPSIGILGNLHSLYLDHCNVEDVAILGKLEALQILSFEWSTISRLPEEIGKLTNLRLLNLNHCYSLRIIMPGALKDLVNLEELHMKESLDRGMGKHEKQLESCVAGLAELKSLTKLASLEISIPDPIILSEDGDLPFENLDKFWINIGHAKEMEYEGLTTMNLNLRGYDSILSKKGFEKYLQKTQRLYLSDLNEFEESPCELCTQGFQEVKYLDIKDSPSIKYIAESSNAYSSNGLPLIAFGKLESFFLQNLINLEKICHGPIAPECFNKLKAVRVRQCSKLKYLWCLSDVQRLKQLEEIEVSNCDSMQSIVTHDAGEDIVSTNNKVELPKARDLGLYELPNMTSFCHTSIQVSLPHLESLTMDGLLGPKDVKLQGISILRNLRDLYIYKTGLSFLFSVSVAKCFREIRTIRVSDCPNMKVVIVDEGRNEGTYDIIEFPLLEYLSIYKCRVEKFFSYPCGKKEPVTTTSDSQDANSDSFFDQKVAFPNITVLKFDGLQCKELWNNQILTDSFQKLESLKLENCDNLQRIAPPQMWKVLQCCLKNLEVISCHSIEIIYEGHGMDAEGGELRELLLRDLKNMKHIWQPEDLPNVPFPNLIDVNTVRCPHLEVLFTTFTAKFLGQMKKLVVESCENMELIAGLEKGKESTGRTITFSKLTVLRLSNLLKFRRFFLPEKYSRDFRWSEDFPSLEVLSIKSCGGEADLVLLDGVNLSAGDGGDFITDSRASVFQGIMKALNDEKEKVVGVYGPGGVGKTTLLEIVQKKLRKDRRPFRMIVKAEVSQTPDLINIQYQIADALSLNLKVKETQQGRSELLFQRLQRDPNEKVLIILEDLWGALDLEAIGIPLGNQSMNCKLLLTSRDESVLEHMRADQKFRLEGLEHDEVKAI